MEAENTSPKLPPAIDLGFSAVTAMRPRLTRWTEKQKQPIEPINWVVKSLLAAGDITVLASEGGLGKSWKAAHVAMQVASGDWVDDVFPSVAGNVIWYDNENGPAENTRRCQILDKEKGIPGARFRHHDVFFREAHWTADEAGLKDLHADLDEFTPSLLIIDSLVSMFPSGTSENDAAEVRAVMDGLAQVLRFNKDGVPRANGGVACLILHHTKKSADSSGYQKEDEWPTYRGSTDIKNSISFLVIMRGKTFENKDGVSATRIQFRFDKARRGRKDDNVYEYELIDHGIPETPAHWIEYVSHGKATSFKERCQDKIVEALSGYVKELSLQELQESWDGFPTDKENFRKRVLKDLLDDGIITMTGGDKSKNAKYCLAKNKTN